MMRAPPSWAMRMRIRIFILALLLGSSWQAAPASVCLARLEPAFPRLPALPELLGLYQPPGDSGTWYAALKSGRLLTFANHPQADKLRVAADLSARVETDSEMGLLGVAFHPRFKQHRTAFLSFNDDAHKNRSTITRYRVKSDGTLDIRSEETVLTLDQPAKNHNGGHIVFGPDGYLFLGFGDGGGSGDTYGNGQNPRTWHSKLLRLDVDSARPYAVPPDNPFANGKGMLPEVYAHGLRNPWRWSFDRKTGQLWLADVGQNRIEEINRIRAGSNYGWPVLEGSECFKKKRCNRQGFELPVAEYTHDEGCSVTGGFVYRGRQVPALAGQFVYGDFCSGRIWALPTETGAPTPRVIADSGMSIASFAEDNAGELYALNFAGDAGKNIYRFVPCR